MNNIYIRNCSFENFSKSGIGIAWSEKDTKIGDSHDEIYRRTPNSITLENIVVKNSGRTGVYIDDYVSNVIIKNSTIINSGGAAIYLDFSTREIKIYNDKIAMNGLIANREAIAIDSSSDNLIEGNHFDGNSAGSIFLYKNCGEQMRSGKQVIRWMHSDNNIIRNYMFLNENIGVWIASRQSRNLGK